MLKYCLELSQWQKNFNMARYRKKPVVVEAIRWTGNNADAVREFTQDKEIKTAGDTVIIPTLEGDMMASLGDYIIKGVSGEFYPCKPDIFWKTYEEVNEA